MNCVAVIDVQNYNPVFRLGLVDMIRIPFLLRCGPFFGGKIFFSCSGPREICRDNLQYYLDASCEPLTSWLLLNLEPIPYSRSRYYQPGDGDHPTICPRSGLCIETLGKAIMTYCFFVWGGSFVTSL